jgi:AcrR family transcriptional regulator
MSSGESDEDGSEGTTLADQERKQVREQLADARISVTETGRVNQKLRTRQALIDAAGELVAAGASPTLAEVAERALVSKTTAYRYFASAEALIQEVFFDRDFPTVDEVLGATGDEPTARVLAVEEAVNDALLSHESAMRVIVRNAIDTALAAAGDAPPRVGRRQKLIAAALEPVEGELEPDVLQRLRDALALVIGPEAILAARDVCGLSPDETRKVTRWATEALVAHALSQGAGSAARPRPRGRAR